MIKMGKQVLSKEEKAMQNARTKQRRIEKLKVKESLAKASVVLRNNEL